MISTAPPTIPAIAPVDSADLVVPREFVSDESPPGVVGSTLEESEVVASDEPALVVVALPLVALVVDVRQDVLAVVP